MGLQPSKQGSVVMFEIKVLQSKFGVFNCHLIERRDPEMCYLGFYGNQNQKQNKANLSIFFGDHVEVRLFFTPNRGFWDLVVVVIILLWIFQFVRNLKHSTHKRLL